MLTTAQVAAILDTDPRYVRRLIKAGKLKATLITPRLLLIDERDLEQYRQEYPKSKAGRPRRQHNEKEASAPYYQADRKQ